MSLGAITAKGKVVRGPLNERFLAYVRWLVDTVGTPDLKQVVTDQHIHVAFWIHGKLVRMQGTKRHAVAAGMMMHRTGYWWLENLTERIRTGAPPPPRDALMRHAIFHDLKRPSPTRFVIQISRLVLIQPRMLAQTIIHELKHVADALNGRIVGYRSQDVEARAYNAERRVLTLTDSELARAYQEHFGDVLAERMGRKPLITTRQEDFRDALRAARRALKEEEAAAAIEAWPAPDPEDYDPYTVPYRPASRTVRIRRKPR